VPAISVDTFFACSLMVLLVLSAMATTSKLLYPYINNTIDSSLAERYRDISKYLLLNDGTPANWGQNCQTIPEAFGLADAESDNPYALDIDKVSRLNSENPYAMSYAQIFTALKMSDVSFRLEIKPIFDVTINLTATFQSANETSYQFEILTQENGIPIQAELKCYAIAEDFLEADYVYAANGESCFNITIPNDVEGPALLVAFAKAIYDSRIVSFGAYAFAHGSTNPKPKNTFLRLSPLNHTLTTSFIYSGINLSRVYALTVNYYSVLEQTASDNQSAIYSIPHFLDSSPTLIVATGLNSTAFFTEWTAYPQIPLQTGANFAGTSTLSDIFAYTYIITINSALYECTLWLGGPKE
jgi:hypothetical protein